MSLPSQNVSRQSRRSNMYRSRSIPWRTVGGIALFIGLAWLLWGLTTGDEAEGLDDPLAQNPLDVFTTPDESTTGSDEPGGGLAPQSDDRSEQPREEHASISMSAGTREPIAASPAGPSTPDPQTSMREQSANTPRGAPEHSLSADPAAASAPRALRRLRTGLDLMRDNRPLEARHLLTASLDSGELAPTHAQQAREALHQVNDRLVFSPEVVEGDPFAFTYTIESGDTLAKIRRKNGLSVDWRLLPRINNISNPRAIRVGQRIKLVTGPFHAVVSKRDYRMDIYMGHGHDRVFVRSFKVGLGEFNTTPIGIFKVRENSKLINPEWANPRTGERFEPDDPMNPIGEYWIGLEGMSEHVRDVNGYGIHGTIDLDSIGEQQSMGCIRMRPDDIALVYELLTEHSSEIEIRAE